MRPVISLGQAYMTRLRKQKTTRTPPGRRQDSVSGAMVVVAWAVTLLIVGITVFATIVIYRRQHHVHVPVHWILICVTLMGGTIWVTVRWCKPDK